MVLIEREDAVRTIAGTMVQASLKGASKEYLQGLEDAVSILNKLPTAVITQEEQLKVKEAFE